MTISYYTTRMAILLALWHAEHVSTFTLRRPTPPRLTQFLLLCQDKDAWVDAHLAHGLAEVQEPDAVEMLESEEMAAFDAHDALDAGMEAAAEERAVMLAAEMTHRIKFPKAAAPAKKQDEWNEAHLAHGIADVHEEDATELRESEEMAAFDAHDAPDAGMEAAAEEWAVMLAAELTHKLKTKQANNNQSSNNNKDDWNKAHLAHGVANLHEEDNEELLASEEAAAVDAHDAPDAGMEAAAEERAIMLAAELAHTLKQKALSQQKEP